MDDMEVERDHNDDGTNGHHPQVSNGTYPLNGIYGMPSVFEGFVPAQDLFGQDFQRVIATQNDEKIDGYSDEALDGEEDDDEGSDDNGVGGEDEDQMDADPDALPSVELPDMPDRLSDDESDVMTPRSYDDRSDDDDEDDNEDNDNDNADVAAREVEAAHREALGPSPYMIPVPAAPKRKRGRPRKRTGQRGGWNRDSRMGPRAPMEPTPEFAAKYHQAMRAYSLENDLDAAHELIVEAIAINPEVFNAHILLSHIWEARGDTANAVQALWTGAHCFPRDPFVWQKVVEACLERATYARTIALNQASYALRALLKINANDCEALFQLASVERESQRPKKALDLLDRILLEMPHNTDALKMYAETCITMSKVEVAINRYKEAITHYRINGMTVDDRFEWTDVSQYIDLLSLREGNRDMVLQSCIDTLKKLSRWMLGRSSESYWDTRQDDDAEFDLDDIPRRIAVPSFVLGRYSPEQYGLGLPMQIRSQLGILRLRQGYGRDEAFDHFAWLEVDDVSSGGSVHQFPEEFLAVARALNEAMEQQEALRYFDALLRVDSNKEIEFWLGIGYSAYICEQKERAFQHFQSALALDEDSIVAKTFICKVLTEQGNKLLAIKYGCEAVEDAHAAIPNSMKGVRKYEPINNRLEREAAESALKAALKLRGPAPPKKRQGRILEDGRELNALQLIKPGGARRPDQKRPKRLPRLPTPVDDQPQRVEDILPIFNTLMSRNDDMKAGDSVATRIWQSCARTLLNDFRANESFFPSDKKSNNKVTSNHDTPQSLDVDNPVPSIEHQNNSFTTPAHYRYIPLDTWLDIFLEYALLTSVLPDPATAQRSTYNIIATIRACPAWSSNPSTLFLIQCVHMTCAINLRDQITLFGNILPWFMINYPFNTDAYRLFQAVQNLFPYPNDPAGKFGQMDSSYVATSKKARVGLFRHLHAIDHFLDDTYTDPTTGEPVPEFMRRKHDNPLIFYDPSRPQAQVHIKQEQDQDQDQHPPPSPNPSTPFHSTTTSKGTPLRTTEMDAVLLVLYAQLHYAKGQYLCAIPWFHRARALCPEHPLIALQLALSYIQQPLKPGFKLAVNQPGAKEGGTGTAPAAGFGEKHNWILQGVAMLEEYTVLRIGEAERKDGEEGERSGVQEAQRNAHMGNTQQLMKAATKEIAFNRARCWAMLSLAGLAVEGFEGILLGRESSQQQNAAAAAADVGVEGRDAMDIDIDNNNKTENSQGNDDIDMATAYTLRTTYALNGNMALARGVTERWLVV